MRRANPDEYSRRAIAAMGEHVGAMLDLKRLGAVTFDYGNNIRAQAQKAGVADAFEIPGFVPEYIRPLFCQGRGPFRWAALSGNPQDIARTDQLALEDLALGDGTRLDAALTALPIIQDAIKDSKPFKVLGDPVYYEDLAAAFDQKSSLDSKPLADAVSKIIDEMRKDGTLTALSNKYYGIDLTTKK